MTDIRTKSITNERVFEWWDYPIFVLLSILSLGAILYFLLHWFSFEDWLLHPVSFSLMTAILLVILTNNQGRWFLPPLHEKAKAHDPDDRVGGWPSLRPLCQVENPSRCWRELLKP